VAVVFAGCPPEGFTPPPSKANAPSPLPTLEQSQVLELPTAWLPANREAKDVGLFGFLPVRATTVGPSVRLELLVRVGHLVGEQSCNAGGSSCSLGARWRYSWRSLCVDVRERTVTTWTSCVVSDPEAASTPNWSRVMDDSTPLTPASQWIRAHSGFPDLDRPNLDVFWLEGERDHLDEYGDRWPRVAHLSPTLRLRLGRVVRWGQNQLRPLVWRLEDADEGIGFSLDTGRVRHLWTLERDGQPVAQYLTQEGDVFELTDVRRFGATERQVATSLGGPRIRPVLVVPTASGSIVLAALEDEEARVDALKRNENVSNTDLNVLQYRLAVAFRPSLESQSHPAPLPSPVFAWATSLQNVLLCFNTAFEQWPGLSIEGLRGVEVLGARATTALPQCAAVSVRGLVSGVGARLSIKGLPSRAGTPPREVEVSVRPSPAPSGLGHEYVYRSTLAWRNPLMSWRPLGQGASYATVPGFVYVDVGDGTVSEFRVANDSFRVSFPESMVALSGTAWLQFGDASFLAVSRDVLRQFSLGGDVVSKALPLIDGSLVVIRSSGGAVRFLPYGGTQPLTLPFEPAAIRGGFFDAPELLVALDGGYARYTLDGGLAPLV
jgi:hypothetical protein